VSEALLATWQERVYTWLQRADIVLPDLTTLFNWNTKQIFLYITASYPSSDPSTIPPSEAIIWDAIIPADSAPWHQNTYIHPAPKGVKPPKSKLKGKAKKQAAKAYPEGGSPGIVKLSNQKPKYQITDFTGKIAERENATLTLQWNVQPWVGALVWTNKATVGRWQGLKGGLSKTFSFPSIKGSEAVKKEDLKTETGGEKNRGKPA
jgi:signal peptidase complex subunit 3